MIFITLFSIFYALYTVWHVKKQILGIKEALEDVRNGNGNRRLLTNKNELVAPLIFELNAIISSYENRLVAYRQTEDTNRQLMTSLSHDVRTPLTILIGYLDAVHKALVTGKEREDYIEIARHKAHDLKEYVDVLFDWFKLNSNEFSINLMPVDLTELTRDILIDWIPILEDTAIDYTIKIPERPFETKIDPDGYIRIVNNLMQNVIMHSKADKIVMTLLEENNAIWLRVADNGVGIEKEELKDIFKRFYKKRTKKGNGIGLAIVQQLTQKMGGQIFVESQQGIGTTFIVSFPIIKYA